MSVAIPPKVQQVVLFSSGPWGERTCVNADLYDAHRTPITIGKLTPYNRLDAETNVFEQLGTGTLEKYKVDDDYN